jgi:tryptophan synthase alpha chain
MTMNHLELTLESNREHGRASLVFFFTAGYPSLRDTVDLAVALEDGGADAIEIGMPFSDPMADGPMIQKSSAAALANGVTLQWTLEQVARIRNRSALPIILMGYVNPLVQYGVERFFVDAAAAGVHGVILPEVPLDEWPRFAHPVASQNLCGILLATPTSSVERIQAIDKASRGFVYAVSTTGVTGGVADEKSLDNIRVLRHSVKKNPMLVGFGVSTPVQAAAFAGVSDGVIVGSALLRELENGKKPAEIGTWVTLFRKALK